MRTRTVTLVIAGLLCLTGCSAGAPSAETPTASDAAPAASVPAASATPSAIAAVAAPSECDDVKLAPASSVSGQALGACVVAFSRAAGSGHAFVQSGDSSAEVDFVFSDRPEMSGTMTGADGVTAFVLTQNDSWIRMDGAWVHGDPAGTDPRQVVAATVGTTYRAMADPSLAASLIASAPSWTVQPNQDQVTLPNGQSITAWRVQADAPFSALGTEVQQMVVWLTSQHTVVGNQATVSVGGMQTTTLQQYTDWGVPVKIEPPVQ